MLTLHRELHSDWAGWIVSGKICLCFFCEHWVRTSPCTREQMPSVLSNCTYWGCTLVSQHDMPAVFLNCCKTAVHRGPCPSYISFSCGGCTACMFLILSRMHWIPQLMCSRKHDFELAPTGNFEFSPVCLFFQRHAGLLQLACMVLYIRPTALSREPAGPAWYMDALWSGGGYSNRMFWDNAEKWWCSKILEVEPF